MSISSAEAMLGDIAPEFASTRRFLERIPDDKLEFTPHEKSWTVIKLATHIVHLLAWFETMTDLDDFDLATFDPSQLVNPKTRDELLAAWDDKAQTVIDKCLALSNERLTSNWVMRKGDQVMLDQPRIHAIRLWGLSHVYHHRAQLGVYLRLLDVPVPAAYGDSADEGSGF